ncbi:MAG: hypothetical protein P8009_09375 [Gammaproteobacteria bacterium]
MDDSPLPIYEVQELSVREALQALAAENDATETVNEEEAERAHALGWARPWVQAR